MEKKKEKKQIVYNRIMQKEELPKAFLEPHPTNPNILMDKKKGIAYYVRVFGIEPSVNSFGFVASPSVKLIQLNKERKSKGKKK